MGPNDQAKIKIAREYFMRADQGRPDILELVKGFEGSLEDSQHDDDHLTFIPSADYLVVEGTTEGRMSGKSWAVGKTPGGRFCNLFKFRDGRISSLHIYLDPDY